MMSHMTRKGDAAKFWWSVFGVLLLAIVAVLKWRGAIGDLAFAGGLVLGAGMIRPDFVVDVVKAWKGKPDEPA